jgi:hypothetical protein
VHASFTARAVPCVRSKLTVVGLHHNQAIGFAREQCARNHLILIEMFNPTFISRAEICSPGHLGGGQEMDDASGKFALVMLRAERVRVHHKRTKHEYVFRVAGNHLDVGECVLHPNPAALSDPRTYREEAEAAAEWFVANRQTPSTPVPNATAKHGWVAA